MALLILKQCGLRTRGVYHLHICYSVYLELRVVMVLLTDDTDDERNCFELILAVLI